MSNLKAYVAQPAVQDKFMELLQDEKKVTNFQTSLMQVVNGNAALKNCSPASIVNSAAMAAVLDLPINSNFGEAYIVPYGKEAQFQLGYKGFIQLAIRSGSYKTINSAKIYQGQLKGNPLDGYEFDFSVPPSGDPIGYAAKFVLSNGFEKTFYMSRAECEAHGKRFSKTYDKAFSIWKKDFDGMALKTVLKLLLDKYGPKSLTMQKAIASDQGVIDDDLNPHYKDNPEDLETQIEDVNAEFVDDENGSKVDYSGDTL